MEIKQIKLSRMATFCYLVGDESSKSCVLIDPAFDTKRILDAVDQGGYQVTHVINTHSHSDHTAGNAAMIAATGAKLLIHDLDAGALQNISNRTFSRLLGGKGSAMPDVLLKDEDMIEVGGISELDMYGFIQARVLSKGCHGRTKEISVNLPPELSERLNQVVLIEFDLNPVLSRQRS